MIVWIVFLGIAYEGSDPMGVFDSQEKAIEFEKKIKKDSSYEYTYIDELELNSESKLENQ